MGDYQKKQKLNQKSKQYRKKKPQGMHARSKKETEAQRLARIAEQRKKQQITIQDEFREECAVVRFKDMPSGKKALMSKKEMNAKLGKNRSMDLLDPCAMRFLPVLEYPYGEELTKTMTEVYDDDDEERESIYDDYLYGG